MTKFCLYDDAIVKILQDDPDFTLVYLCQAFLDIEEEGGENAFLRALSHVIAAQMLRI